MMANQAIFVFIIMMLPLLAPASLPSIETGAGISDKTVEKIYATSGLRSSTDQPKVDLDFYAESNNRELRVLWRGASSFFLNADLPNFRAYFILA